jgi:hypothetical protein
MGREKLAKHQEAGQLALQMKMKGASLRDIAEKLNQEYPDKGISHVAVQTFLDNAVYQDLKMLESADAKTKEEALKHILDVSEQLKMINDETWNIAREAKTPSEKLKAFDHILRQLELSSRLAGQIKTGATSITKVNMLQLGTELLPLLKSLENRGYIKIIRDINDKDLKADKNEDIKIEGEDGFQDNKEPDNRED